MTDKISEKQFFTLTASFLMGNSLAITGGISKGEKIGYMTLFGSYILFVLLCFLYSKLFKSSDSSDLYLLCENLLGKIFSKFVFFVILLYSLFTAFLSTKEFLFFISLSSDFSAKPIWTALLFSICILSVLLCGKKALARYSELILPFVLFVIAAIFLMGANKINLSNLKIDNLPESNYIISNIYMNFVSPFSNIMLVYFFSSELFNKKQIKKASLRAGLLSLFVISAIYAMNLLIIGKKLMGSLYFPTLYTFSVINPSLFAERSEAIFFITYIFFDMLYTAVAYFIAIDCFSKLFFKKNTFSQKKKKVLITLAAIFSFIVMNIKFDIEDFYSSLAKIPYISSIITVGLPLLLLLSNGIKQFRFFHASKNNSPPQ